MAEPGNRLPRALRFGDFTLDVLDERLHSPAGPVKLGNKAYRLLVALIEQDGRLLTKDVIFSSVWDGTIVSESALTSVVKELRRALGDESRTPRFIESVYGRGYRFIAAVTPTHGASTARSQQPRSEGQEFAAVAPPPASPAVPDEARPPVIVIAEFNDSAIRESYPHCAAELREEVLSGLARFREIQLIADDRPEPEAAAARQGQRGYCLSARLLPDADGVKLIARANRLTDGLIVWAETLALANTGTAGGVEKIVRRIVGAALPAVDEDLFLGLSQASGAFYDRYLLAKRRSLTADTFAEANAAAAELEALIAERPSFGLAYPPLVRLYNTDFGFTALGSSGPRERGRALSLARAGLAADRGNVHAHTVLGFCYLYHGEHELARNCFEHALTLNPYNAVRLNEVASGMAYLGEFDRAHALLEMSLHLQPFPDDSFHSDTGALRLISGDCEGARRALEPIVHSSIWAELYLALCELGLGLEEGLERFLAWRRRVESGWHARPAPSSADISAWVRRHHPFRGGAGQPLFEAVDRALLLEPAGEAASAAARG